jgi:glucose-1-phosphate thymidylyltransferase
MITFVSCYQAAGADCITVHELMNVENVRTTGVVEVDEQGKVVGFEEKSQAPKSNPMADST